MVSASEPETRSISSLAREVGPRSAVVSSGAGPAGSAEGSEASEASESFGELRRASEIFGDIPGLYQFRQNLYALCLYLSFS